MDDFLVVNQRMGVRLINEANANIERRRIGEVITGNLGGSLHAENSPTDGAVYANAVYARIQQDGGTIHPKPGKKLLAIPAIPRIARLGLKPSLMPKESLRLQPRKDKSKPPFLVDAETDEILFWLAPSVTIPDRGPFLFISDELQNQYEKDVTKYMVEGTL